MGCVKTNCRYSCVGKGYQEQTQKNNYDNTCPLKLLQLFLNIFSFKPNVVRLEYVLGIH